MTGRITVSYFGNESLFVADDLLVAALERVIRERLAAGGTLYLSAAGAVESGRDHITAVLTPQTFVLATYTDLDSDPNLDPRLTATVELLRRHVETYGGICLDANDLQVEPA